MANEAEILRAADIVAGAKNLVAFSGAGVSAESGIPTFRDPGGIWDRFDPDEVGTTGGIFSAAAKKPEVIREFLSETVETFEKAQPNPGHFVLADLERMNILRSVITQNIDDLHFQAGNTRIFEVHGNLYRQRCLACDKKTKLTKEAYLSQARSVLIDSKEFELIHLLSLMPLCECGSSMRPDVVMFGEAVQAVPESIQEASTCDVMLILGTSGVVYPAASLPRYARGVGARIIDINPREHPFADISDVVITEKTGVALPRILEQVKKIKPPSK